MATGPKTPKHGGKREGSGRKPETLSQTQVKAMLAAAKRRAKLESQTIDDILLDFIYAKSKGINCEVPIRDRLAAIKIYKDFTMSKVTEQHQEVTINKGPVIGLPEMKPESMPGNWRRCWTLEDWIQIVIIGF